MFAEDEIFMLPYAQVEMTARVAYIMALFTVSLSHLHYNAIQRGCEAISDQNYKIAQNCLTHM